MGDDDSSHDDSKDDELHIDVEDTEAPPALDDLDPDEIEQDRQERLDPDNRPEGAEIDNTQRTFDTEKGAFTDSDDYDELEAQYVGEEDLGSGGEESEKA